MKFCPDCERNLPLTDFYMKKRKTGLFPFLRCKTCQNIFQGKRSIPHKHTLYRKSYKQRAKEEIDKIKQKPCADCKKTYPPYIMDFDHVRGEKSKNVSSMVGRNPISAIMAEIEKCDIVCSNCHRQRTHQRRENLNKRFR